MNQSHGGDLYTTHYHFIKAKLERSGGIIFISHTGIKQEEEYIKRRNYSISLFSYIIVQNAILFTKRNDFHLARFLLISRSKHNFCPFDSRLVSTNKPNSNRYSDSLFLFRFQQTFRHPSRPQISKVPVTNERQVNQQNGENVSVRLTADNSTGFARVKQGPI